MTAHIPAQVAEFERELRDNPALCERILRSLPPAPAQPERVIRTSAENVDRAIARGLARAAIFSELTTIEIVRKCDASDRENS